MGETTSFLSGLKFGLSTTLETNSEPDADLAEFYNGLSLQLIEAVECESYPPLFYKANQPTLSSPTIQKTKSRCQECQAQFVSLKGLNQHKAKIHDKLVKNVNCSICCKWYKHKYALDFHVKQVHEKSTRVKCDICMKLLYNKYAHRKHMQHQHGRNAESA